MSESSAGPTYNIRLNGPPKNQYTMQMKSGTSSHSVCIFSVKYTLWPAAVRLPANSALGEITADVSYRTALACSVPALPLIQWSSHEQRMLRQRFAQWLRVVITLSSFRCKPSIAAINGLEWQALVLWRGCATSKRRQLCVGHVLGEPTPLCVHCVWNYPRM